MITLIRICVELLLRWISRTSPSIIRHEYYRFWVYFVMFRLYRGWSQSVHTLTFRCSKLTKIIHRPGRGKDFIDSYGLEIYPLEWLLTYRRMIAIFTENVNWRSRKRCSYLFTHTCTWTPEIIYYIHDMFSRRNSWIDATVTWNWIQAGFCPGMPLKYAIVITWHLRYEDLETIGFVKHRGTLWTVNLVSSRQHNLLHEDSTVLRIFWGNQ